MESINAILCGIIMPLSLMLTGIWLGTKMKFFFLLHPKRLIRDLKSGSVPGGISPLRALSQALAGTLGVGNMAGVAAAITAGGAGSIFWMWISAIVAMSLKYFEVALGVKFRQKSTDGYFGGAMYYIRGVFAPRFPKLCVIMSLGFAVLCVINSLLTGNIMQMNAACKALPGIPPILLGALVFLLALPAILGRGKRVSLITSVLIPVLAILYIFLSLSVIIPSLNKLPRVFGRIFSNAFSLESAGGGIGGFLITRSLRFGTARGILSNEAGSGTSPTAHAAAATKSPHHQGCFGIFEVFADTVVLCTLTALVILLCPDSEGLSGISLTVYAFSTLAGEAAGGGVAASVLLFAYATLICQSAYGIEALCCISQGRVLKVLYVLTFGACCTFAGCISEGVMWQWADMIISLMTTLNIMCLIYAARKGHLTDILP